MDTVKSVNKNETEPIIRVFKKIIGPIERVFKNNIRQYAMLIALVAITILFQILTDGILLVPRNVTNLILQYAYVMILAIGMILPILTGGNIDLSVGSVVAFVGAMSGVMIVNNNMNVWLGIFLCLLIGLAIGVWQGFWIAFVKVPPFICTLAGMLIFRGLTYFILTGGQTISQFPESYQKISSGFLPGFFVKAFGEDIDITTLVIGIIISVIYIILEIRKRSEKVRYNLEALNIPLFIGKLIVIVGAINLFTFWLARFRGTPIILIVIGALILIYTFITSSTKQGRYLYATGGNAKAARLSGINTNKVMFWSYVNMSVLAAVAGIAVSARLNAAQPTAGQNFELDAIAACFIGGASAYGGVGTIVGAIIGALVMGVLNNGMQILGLGTDWQMTIKGLVLLGAVAFDVFSKRKENK